MNHQGIITLIPLINSELIVSSTNNPYPMDYFEPNFRCSTISSTNISLLAAWNLFNLTPDIFDITKMIYLSFHLHCCLHNIPFTACAFSTRPAWNQLFLQGILWIPWGFVYCTLKIPFWLLITFVPLTIQVWDTIPAFWNFYFCLFV